jgi:hypothetical protein
MFITTRISKSLLLILTALYPSATGRKTRKCRAKTLDAFCPAGYLQVFPEDLHLFFSGPGCASDPKKPIAVFIPHVLPLTAPFVLYYLKRNGFSGCRAEVAYGGLTVHASR